jgi:hypothetical protein
MVSFKNHFLQFNIKGKASIGFFYATIYLFTNNFKLQKMILKRNHLKWPNGNYL